MIDITKDIYDKLAATSTVTAIAGSRIWGDRSTPPKSYRPDNGSAVCFQSRGGQVAYDARVMRVSYKFKIYGATNSATVSPQAAAFSLYSAIFDAIQDSAFSNIRFSNAEILPQMMEEFALNWPYALAFFEFTAVNDG